MVISGVCESDAVDDSIVGLSVLNKWDLGVVVDSAATDFNACMIATISPASSIVLQADRL